MVVCSLNVIFGNALYIYICIVFTVHVLIIHKNRFGDGDLGPRGMALFFKTFRHCDLSDRLGIPIFPLSRNERKHQAKYSEDESTLSEGSTAEEEMRCNFRKLDENRQKRKSVLMRPIDIQSDQSTDTDKR